MRTTAPSCVEIKFTWRCRFLTARRSQRGHVIAEKRLSRVDFHTGDDDGEEQGALESAVAAGVVARREALPVNTPTSVLEACRSVVAATLFYGTDLYHYVHKYSGKYRGEIRVRGITTITPSVASAELAAALVTTGLEAPNRRPFANSRTFERVAPRTTTD